MILEQKKKNLPALRFPEFNDGWVLKTMRDISKINQGLQIAIADRLKEPEEGAYFYITNEFLKENSKAKYYIKNPTSSVLCDEEDILMTRTGNTGMVVTNVTGAFHNNFFKIDYNREIVEKGFLYYYLVSTKVQNLILRLAGTSTIPDLNHGDFYKITIPLPTKSEQQKIADFLTAVDERIQKLSRKKELLEQYKKGVMQQLFSQQIRFKPAPKKAGDDNGNNYPDWEEKAIKDIGYFYYGKSAPKWSISEDAKTPCVRYGELYTKFNTIVDKIYSYTNIEPENLRFSKGGEVLVPRVGEDPKDFAKCSFLPFKDIAIGEMISVFNTGENGLYISYYFNTLSKQFARMVEGGNVSNLYYRYLEDINITIPSKAEQQKIADYLSSIDDKIIVLNKELEQSKEFKKGLLQQMFPA